jgi:hypothetical protein
MIVHRYLGRTLLLCSYVLTCLSGCKAWSSSTVSPSRIVRGHTNRLSVSQHGPISATRCRTPTDPLASAGMSRIPRRQQITPTAGVRSRVSLAGGFLDVEESSNILVPILLIVAGSLFVAAQGWINQLLSGDRGLGAFLSDGSGFSKSGFRPVKSGDESEESQDPLPWLRLPRLDFVEVAGQDTSVSEEAVLDRLEELRLEMNDLLEKENFREASAVKDTLEKLMRENGVEFQYSQPPSSGRDA